MSKKRSEFEIISACKMEVVTLADCCEFIKDGTHNTPEKVNQGIPVLSAGNVYGGSVSFETDRFATEEDLAIFRKRLYPKIGDVLLTIVGTIGRAAVLTEDRPLIFQRSVCVLRPKSNLLDSLYFRYALESQFVQKQFEKEQQGVAQLGIYLETLNEIQLPLPPLPEQKRIASLLRRADRLRQLRRTAHDLGNSLLQSVFLEMFGDLKFPEIPLSDLCYFITKGTTPQSSDIKNYASEADDVPFLKVYHLTNNGKLDFNYSPSYVSRSIHDGLLSRSKVYPNDLLMNIVGPPLGKFGIVPSSYKEWNVNQAIAIFRAKEKIKPLYLLHALMYPRILEKLLQQAVGIRQQNLSLEQCRDFRIPIPPLSLQEKFAGVVRRVEALRGRMSESERQVEGLFESLLHDAFQG